MRKTLIPENHMSHYGSESVLRVHLAKVEKLPAAALYDAETGYCGSIPQEGASKMGKLKNCPNEC